MFDHMLDTGSGYGDITPLRYLNDTSDILSFFQNLQLEYIDDYKFDYQLGEGMASLTTVFKKSTGDRVVFKFLIMPRNDIEYQRFINEYQALKGIEFGIDVGFPACPKILIDFTQHNNLPIFYFGMEFIEGKTLNKIIEQEILPWKWNKTIDVIHRTTVTLLYIHANGYVHKDLHTGNILITELEENVDYTKCLLTETGIRILDLGNRINWRESLLKDLSGKRKLIEDKYRLEGSLSSWSPEYILNADRTELIAQDIWSIGVLMFRLLTGKYPIEAENITELIQKYKRTDIYIKWQLIPENIPKPLFYLLQRMLEPDSNKRIKAADITNILYQMRFNDLFTWNQKYLDKFMKLDGKVDDPLDYIY